MTLLFLLKQTTPSQCKQSVDWPHFSFRYSLTLLKEMESLKIKSLRVVFNRVYPNIVSWLSSATNEHLYEDGPPGKKMKLEDEAKVVAAIKDELDKLGIYGNYLRDWLWKGYQHSSVEKRPDIYLFSSAILNKSITSLAFVADHFVSSATSTTEKVNCDSTRLMTIIDRQCPTLKNFSFVVPSSFNPTVEKMCCRPFLSLAKLTQLELVWPSSTYCIPFFTEVGTACPGLQHLKMGNKDHRLQFDVEHQVALVIGRNSELLSSSFWHKIEGSDSNLHLIQFDEKLLTPICKSLQYLSVHSGVEVTGSTGYVTSASAFLLRHVPRLKKLAIGFRVGLVDFPSTRLAVQLLHGQSLNPKEVVQVSEVTSKEDGNGGFVSLNWTINSPPSIKINFNCSCNIYLKYFSNCFCFVKRRIEFRRSQWLDGVRERL